MNWWKIILKQLSIIRLLDEETFFVDAGINDGIKQQQFIEVLNPKRSYKNLAQVIDVFDQYTLNYSWNGGPISNFY